MIKNIHQYYVYILSNKRNGTFYIGMTNNIERRVLEHKQGIIEGFTKKYGLHILVYFETHQNVNDAIFERKKTQKMEKAMEDWIDWKR